MYRAIINRFIRRFTCTPKLCRQCLVGIWRRHRRVCVFAGDAVAQGHEVTVSHHVSTNGLDLSKPAGARELYRRLKNAAWIVCNRPDRIGLEPSLAPVSYSEKALGDAVRSSHMPLLVQAYLETHSLDKPRRTA